MNPKTIGYFLGFGLQGYQDGYIVGLQQSQGSKHICNIESKASNYENESKDG